MKKINIQYMKTAALALLCVFVFSGKAQTNLNENIFTAPSTFSPTIKDAVKLSDVPEIKDSVKRIGNIKYGIQSRPMFPRYQVQNIEPARLQNEPLPKLYHSLLKAGYGPLYNMPYGEFWISNTRNREKSYGAHLKHFSSTTHLEGLGYGAFSDNQLNIFGKQFYKKHTLKGDFEYLRNVVHYYGYDTSENKLKSDFTKQRYQLFEPKLQLLSHYTDSTHVNHDIRLSYYNLQNLNLEEENNVRASAWGGLFIQKEKLNLHFLTDYYNHKQRNDTLNDLIVTLGPSFEAKGKQWQAEVGFNATMDNFRNKTRFYFYPKLNVQYDIYESIIIPYAGVDGKYMKNSFRKLSTENPFTDSTVYYQNTNNRYNLFGGLKGNLSSHTSYDVRAAYSQFDSMYFFNIDYNTPVNINNQFNVLYDNASALILSGELKYQMKEKLNISARGNYYIWTLKSLAKAYHKPDYDLTLSANYNIQSKIILRADLFVFGRQWANSRALSDSGKVEMKDIQLKGWVDANVEAEYRYSKMLSFFARFNNIANQRYYRWDRYASQRFNFMLGLSFVPF